MHYVLQQTHTIQTLPLLAKQVVKKLMKKKVVALLGEVGSGKTTFVSQLLSILSNKQKYIQSPTFNYMNLYTTSPVVYHFDIYRMKSEQDFITMGFEEYFDKEGICIIEWADKIFSLLPENTLFIQIEHQSSTSRVFSFSENIYAVA